LSAAASLTFSGALENVLEQLPLLTVDELVKLEAAITELRE